MPESPDGISPRNVRVTTDHGSSIGCSPSSYVARPSSCEKRRDDATVHEDAKVEIFPPPVEEQQQTRSNTLAEVPSKLPLPADDTVCGSESGTFAEGERQPASDEEDLRRMDDAVAACFNQLDVNKSHNTYPVGEVRPTTNTPDPFWDGWYAALIKSRRGNIVEVVTQDNSDTRVPEKDSSSVLQMTFEGYEKIPLGKRKVREALKTKGKGVKLSKDVELIPSLGKIKEDNNSVKLKLRKDKPKKKNSGGKEEDIHKVFHNTLRPVAIEGKKCSRQVQQKIAEAVTLLTFCVIVRVDWSDLEEQLSREMYQNFRDRVLASIAKFVLSLFDMEDFERIYNSSVLIDEVNSFYSDLRNLEFDGNPIMAIAEGKMKLDKFSVIGDHDISDVLWQYELQCDLGRYVRAYPKLFPLCSIEWDPISQYDIRRARKVLENFVPMKEDCKMQLNLEFARGKFFYVSDTLALELWKDIKIGELFRHFADKWEDALYNFIATLQNRIYALTEIKRSMMEHFQDVVTFPLSCGVFGPCTDEVIEVIRIADLERRMQGHRFIGVHHILSGLSHTRVGDFVKQMIHDRKCFSEEPSKSPVYYIYKSSQNITRLLGDEKMGLEHLFLAIMFDKKESFPLGKASSVGTSLVDGDNLLDAEFLRCLKNGEEKHHVISWSNKLFSGFLPENLIGEDRLLCGPVFMVNKLVEAFERGYTLPIVR